MFGPDLISQKLLGTDPRIGFGEAGVTQNEVRPLDFRAQELQLAAREEAAKREAAKQKMLADQINKFNWVNVDGKHTPQYERAKGDFNAVANHMLQSGNVDLQHLSRMNSEINAFAEAGDNEHKTYLQDIDKTIPDYASQFGKNEYNQGEATKVGNVTYNSTPIGSYTGTLTRTNKYGQQDQTSIYDPKANPDLYNINAAADNFTNNYKQLGLNEFANKSDIENGATTTAIENIKKGIYMKKNKDGTYSPGVSDDVLDNYLNYGAVHDYYANKTLPQLYNADAAYIKANPDVYPQFVGMDENQIHQAIREKGDPLRNNLNQDDLVRDIAKKDLESRNKQSIEKKYQVSEDESKVEGGIGVNDSIGTAVQLNGQQNFNVATPTTPGSKPTIKAGWIPSSLYLEQAKLKPFNLTAQTISDVETNGPFADVLNDKALSDKYVSGVPFKPTGIQLLPVQNKNGQDVIYAQSEDKVRSTKGVQYKPYVTGTVTLDMTDIDKQSPEFQQKLKEAEANGETVKQIGKNLYQYTVLIPYDQASSQMQANYGITPDQVNTKLYDPNLNLKNIQNKNTTPPTVIPQVW